MVRFRIFFLLAVLFCLVSCAVNPEELGIAQQQWAKYSEVQRQKILAGHEAVLVAKEREQRFPVTDNWLQVSIQDGMVKMPPFTKHYKYMPATFKIQDGTCQKVELHTYRNRHFVKLDTCYKNNVLLLDPSRYELDKMDGSIRLYYSPLWQNGFTYKDINSDGYVSLHNVTIKIKEIK